MSFHGTGTRITMGLITPTIRDQVQLFKRFSSGPEDYHFAKTHVPLDLATFGDESVVSRSSAKHALARVEGFSEVLLDFRGIRSVGPAFTDEIFRVFGNAHPQNAADLHQRQSRGDHDDPQSRGSPSGGW